MICNTEVPSISNILNKLWIPSDLHSSYIKTIQKYREEITNNIFITYVEPFLDNINHPELGKEYKRNIYAAAYVKQLIAQVNRPSDKK